ncbi:MAG: serine/threonine protein kinase [Actinobacteria bacterium]|nr:serine/threonine protein kinase [Actinomycetota bacterium]
MRERDDLLAGRYRLLDVIGVGGMAVVYRGEQLMHADTVRPVAVKLIRAEHANDDGFRGRFLREAEAVAKLEHPHVIPVYDSAAADGELYLVMRLVPDRDLGTHVNEHGPLPWRKVGHVALQVAAGLGAAHRRDMVHRDVKPSNLLFNDLGRTLHVYVSDFGLVKVGGVTPLTGSRVHVNGTPEYAAPEQLRGKPVGAPADVYALGRALAHLLTGAMPLVGERIDVRALPCPVRMRSAIARATARNPDDRYPDMEAFGRALERALDLDRRGRVRRPVRRRDAGRPSRRTLQMVAATVAATASVAGGLVVGLRHATVQAATLDGSLSVRYGSPWRPANRPDAPKGLELADAIAVEDHAAHASLTVGIVRRPQPGADPASPALRRALRMSSAPTGARLGRLQALVYRGTAAGDRLSVFFVPTSRGWLALACRAGAPGGEDALRRCEALAADVQVARGRPQPVLPDPRYGRALDGALAAALHVRDTARADLAARSLSRRAHAAEQVAGGYAAARRTVARTTPQLRDAAAHAALSRALGAEQAAFSTLATVARRRDEPAYAGARAAVVHADARLHAALAGLRRNGY